MQGVGFRPFVYRTAGRFQLKGWVRNLAGQVEILAQGSAEALQNFGDALVEEAPPLARPRLISATTIPAQHIHGFAILESRTNEPAQIHVPPDYFLCDLCLDELRTPSNRRYRYPFINCTQCGPRYTLIERLPYDRANTTMAGFPLCPRCAAEYENPLDRRFHAEPVACPDCGPQLEFAVSGQIISRKESALGACVAALADGKIVAVKGVGGYHLMCDAFSENAVATLRARKKRPHKPLAVMFPFEADLASLRRAVTPAHTHEAMLLDPMRPLVLIPRRADCGLAANIAPDCGEIGAMLPYSPLHHLLLQDFGRPLVATSGNVGGEPVLTDNRQAEARLGRVADAFLHHDRPIARPADDSVYRVIADRPRPMRIGRGCAPLEIDLPFALPQPLLALGGHLKNTVALAWGQRAVVSPHLGDMGSPRGIALLQEVANDLQSLYDVRAEGLVCDAHPRYATTRLAAQMGLPLHRVFHHHAHASALAGEFPQSGDWLVFTWDGSGFGEDNTIWGGEALLGRPGGWKHVASLRPFSLLGGEKAAREPWRSALALCWEAGSDWAAGGRDVSVIRHAWERGLNCPVTTSAGRLFDAASALLGLCEEASFEGQAPIALEARCSDQGEALSLPLLRKADGMWISDWAPLLENLQNSTMSIASRAGTFHRSLARALIDQASALRAEHGVTRLGLTGGVFQNRVLCEAVITLAKQNGFTTFLPERLPCNDAGLSFGQIIEAGACL